MAGELDKKRTVEILNRILEMELAGVVRYTHFSLMVYGYNRLPIVQWLRGEADSAIVHAQKAGELVTHLGEHPSLAIGPLLETHNHDIRAILQEALEHERATLTLYKELLREVEGRSVMIEEYARSMVVEEETHTGEVDKMLRSPGDIASVVSS
jgi:bacterioferritin